MESNNSSETKDFFDKNSSRDHDSFKDSKKKKKNRKQGGKNSPKDKPKGKNKDGIPWKNDWKFYAANEQIAKDIASIPFNVMNGSNFPLTLEQSSIEGEEYVTNGQRPLPGVLAVEYIPSVGITEYRTDGVNMAATQLYTFVRHANSGAKNYEPADIMMYVLAMKDIYSEYFEIKRAIGIAKTYNYYNHNLPDLVIKSLGIDPVDLRANLAQYRGRLNVLAEKINSFAIPSYFKAFDRAAYISSYVFSDSTSIRGQFYAFKKKGYYKWSGTASESGTSLQYTPHIEGYPYVSNLSTRLNALEDQLNALFLDEDALTMSGDILKAFKEAQLYTVQPTDENYAVVPLHDEDILAQIENCVILTPLSGLGLTNVTYDDLDITQGGQLIKFKPTLRYNNQLSWMISLTSHVFNSHKDDPQYTDVLEWTRLMATFGDVAVKDGDNNYRHSHKVTSCGLELVTGIKVYTYDGDGESVVIDSLPQIIHTYSQQDYNSDILCKIADLTQFDWHPFLYLVDHTRSLENPQNHIHILGDCKVVTTIDDKTIKTINDSACYSAFFARDLY